ncbi:ketoacyl-synt-domain-containing protein [Penicillium hordei]|uniref:Ketoacyl-synt-domain-containing protein n=1 Tax=Penicillium hordei TaxID=40994 RepID=A0AAD6E1N0_9EURO|nr:ketoacyl-synt-domain-containing protein [Penicillium hordei]KAJ5598872.1 ketoacyl-synt-domain-containing protein [Penicillium hordei]
MGSAVLEEVSPNAVAIVGMGCRFSGADSVEDYWRILEKGQSMMSDLPKGRFPASEHQRSTDKTVYFGNYLDSISRFDNRFFKKSSREAASMDPQQRLLLEVSYEALESSGFFGPREPEFDVGCFIGVCASEYNDNVASHPSNAFSALGTLRAFVPGRISHFFGLTGPSIALDTACSSSAVAIDAACKAILHGDCKSAIAGGVSVFTSPFFYQNLSSASFLSSTGASKSFDASADGYCRGEGVGLVILKRLSDAIVCGDNILGTILSTAVRQSSNKVPITVPYSPSQADLYRKLLSTAGITPEAVTYVEAHGTGTPVGDPLEFGAIKEVFGTQSRPDPLYFASVKGNIGHTEGASGVAGLIKIILMMQHRAIPRQAHLQCAHPKISLIPGQIYIPTETMPWNAKRLVACVNNYGAAGSIAAMIVEQPPSQDVATATLYGRNKYPLVITANSPKSLSENCAKLADYVSSLNGQSASGASLLADFTFNLSDRQNRTLPNMFATAVSSLSELDSQLRVVASDPVSTICQPSQSPKPVVLIFGGQTARTVGLSKSVYECSHVFRKYLDDCNDVIKGFGHNGIYPDIFDPAPVHDVVSLQTMQFALQYACAQSWIACGLKANCVLGHSFGQLTALTVSGVLSLVDGLKLVHGRGILMRDSWASESGSMLALEADRASTMQIVSQIRTINSPSSSGIEVACFNGPSSHVLVGSSVEISAALQATKRTNIKTKVLDVTHGFHSRFCDPILPELERLAQGLTFNKPKIPLETCSNGQPWSEVTAKLIAEHTRTPVYFKDAVKRIEMRLGACTWLEVGSNSPVTGMVRRALADFKDHSFCPINLSRDDAMSELVDITVGLWKNGEHVQYWPFHHIQRQDYRHLNLPPYQFEKNEHWLDFDLQAGNGSESTGTVSKSSESALAEPEPVLVTFAGSQDIGNGQKQTTFTIDPRSEEWKVLVAGHSVLHESLCPASMYLELVLRAAKDLANINKMTSAPFARVDELEMASPLGMSQDKIVQLVLKSSDTTGRRFNFAFHSQGRAVKPTAMQTHAAGKCEITPDDDTTVIAEFERTRKLLQHIHKDQRQDHVQRYAEMATQPESEAVYGSVVYKIFSRVVQYHDFYQGVRRLASTNDGFVAAEVSLLETQPGVSKDLLSFPVAIDNFFQVPGLFANCLAPCPSDEVFVSTHVDRIQLSPEFGKRQTEGGSPAWDVFAISTSIGEKESSNDIFVTDKGTNKLVFIVFGAKFSRVKTATLAKILSRANQNETSAPMRNETTQRGRLNTGKAPLISSVSKTPTVVLSQPIPGQQQPSRQTGPQVEAMTAKKIPSPSSPVIQMRTQLPNVETQLRQMLSEITDVPANQFQTTVTLDQLGIDSLMTTEIVSEVQEVFNIAIDTAQLFDLQTFGSLCSYLDTHESRQGSVNSVDQSPQAKLAPPLPSTLAISSAEEQDVIREVVIEQTTSVAKNAGVPDYEELVAQLAGLLGTHLECPPTDFTGPTNLMDHGLDSLLSMELMSDIEEIFGVSIDSKLLLSESSFGHLADILVSAVTSLRPASSTDSTTVTSTRAQSNGMTTPGTMTDNSVDGGDIFTATAKVQSVSTTAVLDSAAQAFESIKGHFDRFAEQYHFSDFYTKVADKQADLVLAYVVEALADFGIDLNTLRPGEQIPRILVAPKHESMIKVFNEILRWGKLADYDGKEYVRSDAIVQKLPSSVLYKDILAQFPQHAKEHTLLNLCGSDMSKLLTGKMDPLAVLFGNKSNREILKDVYSTAPMFVIHSQLLTDYLEEALSTSSPGPDGKFHIMELGAGTGATTRCIVDRLVQCGIPIEYTFTDISSALVTGGKRKFARYDCMKYGTVDIEKEPPAQYLGQFDVVLATNCIHATRNLQNSMGNISKLLQPHGFVSLVELTTRNYWLDMVFGLLDGWWLYDDGRPYVLATPEFWENIMLQVGFQHVSWTGGHTPESEAVRVISGFKQPVQDPSSYRSMPQEKTGNIETVVFAHTDKDLPLRADIRYPSPQMAARYDTWVTGLVIHGGGHVMLSRQDIRPRQIQLLLDNGILPVSIDYRLCPETTILEGPLVDVADAYAWARNSLPSLSLTKTRVNERLDCSRAVVIGWSTGGTLAMSLAWTSIPRGISPPTGILAFYCPTNYEDDFWLKPNMPKHSDTFGGESYNVIDGVYNAPITAYNIPSTTKAATGWMAPKDPRSRVLLHMNWHGQTLPVLFRGLPAGPSVPQQVASAFNRLQQPPKEDVIQASPYAQILQGNYKSPTHIVFGTSDDLIPWEQAQRTVAAMKDAGIESGLTIAPGEPHLFDLYRDPNGCRWGYVMEGYNFLLQILGKETV